MTSSAVLFILAFWLSGLQYDSSVAQVVKPQERFSGEALQSEMRLIDGSYLRGTLLMHSFPLQTQYARVIVEFRLVSDVLVKSNGNAIVNLVNGDRLQGTMQVESLTVESLIGKIEVPLKMVESLSVSSRDAVPTRGLAALYPLDGSALDMSGLNNNGTESGTIPGIDRFGRQSKALRFHSGSRLQVPDSPSLRPSTGLSVCAWINAEQLYDGRCQANAVVFKGSDALPGWYGLLYQDDKDCDTFNPSRPHFGFGIKFDSGVPTSITASSFITMNKFYFVVGTYDGETLRLYVDGRLEGSTRVGKSLSTQNSGDLTIGGSIIEKFPYWVTGVLDDIRIYSRALTNSEISVLRDERVDN